MAASEKVYYLENDKKRFWEVTVRGSDSILRCKYAKRQEAMSNWDNKIANLHDGACVTQLSAFPCLHGSRDSTMTMALATIRPTVALSVQFSACETMHEYPIG